MSEGAVFLYGVRVKYKKRPFLLRGSASDIIGRVYDAFQTLRGGGKVWHLIFEKRCPLSAYQDQFSAFNTWSSFMKIQASLHMFLITATSCATCLWNVKNYTESSEWCQIRAILRRPTAGRLRSVTSLAGGSQGGTLAAAAAGWYAGMLEKGGGGLMERREMGWQQRHCFGFKRGVLASTFSPSTAQNVTRNKSIPVWSFWRRQLQHLFWNICNKRPPGGQKIHEVCLSARTLFQTSWESLWCFQVLYVGK